MMVENGFLHVRQIVNQGGRHRVGEFVSQLSAAGLTRTQGSHVLANHEDGV